MAANKKILTKVINVEDSLYQSAIGVLEQYDLSFEQAIMIYLNSIVNNQALPISLQDNEDAAMDGYFKALVDVIASHSESIFYVNLETNSYREFSTENAYRVLELNTIGKDFFTDTFTNIDIIIHEDDRQLLREELRKEHLIKRLEKERTFTLVYRMITTPIPQYHLMTVSLTGSHKKHVVIEVRNIDAAKQKEQQYEANLKEAQKEARIDSLTNVYNYLAFQEEKAKLSIRLKKKDYSFALAMCDLNDLKKVNDELGHMVGDQYLMDAAKTMRDVFPNSKVFRIGGDEFIIVIEDDDFLSRNKLVEDFKKIILNNINKHKPVVSIGLADIDIDKPLFANIFMLADSRMYENKKELKAIESQTIN